MGLWKEEARVFLSLCDVPCRDGQVLLLFVNSKWQKIWSLGQRGVLLVEDEECGSDAFQPVRWSTA